MQIHITLPWCGVLCGVWWGQGPLANEEGELGEVLQCDAGAAGHGAQGGFGQVDLQFGLGDVPEDLLPGGDELVVIAERVLCPSVDLSLLRQLVHEEPAKAAVDAEFIAVSVFGFHQCVFCGLVQ